MLELMSRMVFGSVSGSEKEGKAIDFRHHLHRGIFRAG